MHRPIVLPPILRFALGLALAAAAGAGAAGPAASEVAPVPMRTYTVAEKPLTCFGLSLQMVALRQTKQVLRMFVREVMPDSEADFNGLVTGTEILSINGRAVDSFVVGFDPQSELGRLFVNRRRGDRVTLVVVPPGETAARTVVLVLGRTHPPDPFVREWPP